MHYLVWIKLTVQFSSRERECQLFSNEILSYSGTVYYVITKTLVWSIWNHPARCELSSRCLVKWCILIFIADSLPYSQTIWHLYFGNNWRLIFLKKWTPNFLKSHYAGRTVLSFKIETLIWSFCIGLECVLTTLPFTLLSWWTVMYHPSYCRVRSQRKIPFPIAGNIHVTGMSNIPTNWQSSRIIRTQKYFVLCHGNELFMVWLNGMQGICISSHLSFNRARCHGYGLFEWNEVLHVLTLIFP